MTEREMNKHQRGMVDGCFEEGHYVRGIATLNQLRMQNLRPSPSHTRQLIYISLYPPPSEGIEKDKGKRKEVPNVSGSPSKQIQQARRLQKQALIPPPEATDGAKELLHQFAMDSISPEALLRAVPCYPLTQAELDNAPRPIKADLFSKHDEVTDEMDSYVAKEAARLKECKDCWSMLRKGVVTRQDVAMAWVEDPFLDADIGEEYDDGDPSSTIIGRHSWNLLEWFVLLFEKDQALAEETINSTEGTYSVLLLSQIMPISSGRGVRSHTDSIADIVLLCYSQQEQWRRNLGKRLMALLFKAISIRLQASPTGLVTTFLGDLPITSLGLTIKLVICDRFLTQTLQCSAGASADGITRARPQARRARPASMHPNGDSQPPSRSQAGLVSQQESQPKWGLPSSQRVLALLDLNSSDQSAARSRLTTLTALFHLIVAFGILRAEDGKETDRLWINAVRSGDLERRICETYADEGLPETDAKAIRSLHLILISQCTKWRQLFG